MSPEMLKRLKRRIEISDLKRQTDAEMLELKSLIDTDGNLWDCMKATLSTIDNLEKQIERIDKAYSMRATDVWLTHNMSPHDYLCKEISEALYGTGE